MAPLLPLVHSLSATHAPQRLTLPLGVVVQALGLGLQLLPLHALSLAAVHCTHAPALQRDLPEI